MYPVKPYHRKPRKGERVWIEQVKMSDIPAGANPFQYDNLNMGTSLVDGWTVMHAGNHSESDEQGLAYIDLVNPSGQRIELVLWPELTIPDNKATAHHKYHLSFSTLGGAHYVLGYDEKSEAVACMIELSTYRNVFRLDLTIHGMVPCQLAWLAGDKVITEIDDYHTESSWGDEPLILVDVVQAVADVLWTEPGIIEGEVHMCLHCPTCAAVVSSIHEMRGLTITHACDQQKVTQIAIPSDLPLASTRP